MTKVPFSLLRVLQWNQQIRKATSNHGTPRRPPPQDGRKSVLSRQMRWHGMGLTRHSTRPSPSVPVSVALVPYVPGRYRALSPRDDEATLRHPHTYLPYLHTPKSVSRKPGKRPTDPLAAVRLAASIVLECVKSQLLLFVTPSLEPSISK